MSKTEKDRLAVNAFQLDRRAFLGAAAVVGAAGAAGVAEASTQEANPLHVEPGLVDATSNAPSYWAHPKRTAKPVADTADPLSLALGA